MFIKKYATSNTDKRNAFVIPCVRSIDIYWDNHKFFELDSNYGLYTMNKESIWDTLKSIEMYIKSNHNKSAEINHLTPNGHYMGRTAQLTSRYCILYMYSTNIRIEYFKHAAQFPFYSLQNAVYFIMLPFLVPVLFTF